VTIGSGGTDQHPTLDLLFLTLVDGREVAGSRFQVPVDIARAMAAQISGAADYIEEHWHELLEEHKIEKDKNFDHG